MQTGIKVHLHCHTMVFSFDGLSGFLIYTSNVIVNPAAKSSSRTSHAVLDSSWNFPATSTQVEKGILPVVWTKPASPSSPRRLRLAIFPSPSSPLRLRHAILAAPSSPRHPRLTVFARARLLLIAVIVERRVFGIFFCWYFLFVLYCCVFKVNPLAATHFAPLFFLVVGTGGAVLSHG
ncbi:hypothetical protein OUZ56_006390 [Daphnia magna]|uniref:Uncharacterized protein n=1 Tax=Daphnia magna TaxID=35525 RepID=A0ABQ9YVN6_9CRUS|nr:hypothetical protein OUZ56_006390 [Daphnia magna]